MLNKLVQGMRGWYWQWRNKNNLATLSEDRLKEVVQKNPYWIMGRRLLAQRALDSNNLTLAYAEYHALCVLSVSTSERAATELLGARVLTRRGDYVKALEKLESLSEGVDPVAVVEEQVACLVALDRKEEAMLCINKLPDQYHTPALKAMKLFMLRRGDGTLYR